MWLLGKQEREVKALAEVLAKALAKALAGNKQLEEQQDLRKTNQGPAGRGWKPGEPEGPVPKGKGLLAQGDLLTCTVLMHVSKGSGQVSK